MTLYAVISDIHANFEALLAVEEDATQIANRLGEDLKYICLGDIVDYGPEPNECMQWVLQKGENIFLIQGNHDADTAVEDITVPPISIAKDWWPITMWTRQALETSHKQEMRRWQVQRTLEENLAAFTLFHGSFRFNHQGKIGDAGEATAEFEKFPTHYGLFGHTHYQGYFVREPDGRNIRPNAFFVRQYHAIPKNPDTLKYFPDTRELQRNRPRMAWYGAPIHEQQINKIEDLEILTNLVALINPGSVGQPRRPQTWHRPGEMSTLPYDSRAAYMLLYANGSRSPRFAFRRKSYDTNKVIEKLLQLRWQDTDCAEYYKLIKTGDIYYKETDFHSGVKDNIDVVESLNEITQALIRNKLVNNFREPNR